MLILHSGIIHTLDTANPIAEAIAVRGERIEAVGESSRVMALADKTAIAFDLQGKTVMPGLVDAHAHLKNLGRMREMVTLYEAISLEDVVERVRARAIDTVKGQWIIGRGWNQELWTNTSMPTNDLSRPLAA